jgi:DcaP outer membrane protein
MKVLPVTRYSTAPERHLLVCYLLSLALLLVATSAGRAQAAATPTADEPRLEIYGFVMTDFGYNIDTIDPLWFDVLRPTKLPAFPGEFGRNGSTFAGVRQTRNGVKGFIHTGKGELKTIFEWELFGVGVDAGQTTFRLRHAYGEIGHFGAGQYWSPFMDIDVFPNSLEYWGPPGMVFFRNVQVRWMPLNGEHTNLTFAVERPGASQDFGVFGSFVETQNVNTRFRFPNVTGSFKWSGKAGYIRAAGLGQSFNIDDNRLNTSNLDQTITTGGVNVSTNIKLGGKRVLKGSFVYGKAIANYMNDATVDIAPELTGNLIRPIQSAPIPVRGIVGFYDHYWSDKWSTSIGYSQTRMTNTSLQLPAEFHKGDYALVNLLYTPDDHILYGGEFQWGRRSNFSDGFSVNDYKVQFSFKYSYSAKIKLD